ncbi:TPA: type II toxin-antitoxin system HipA family toxin [Yersinia enterocolitica]|nr:type II toxin-antitoxin system HipA family toxin [Yersinia enterocolitica]HDL8340391.1 type II toxin-antitoxin system HipA family toxin [Yersinia enterocolitica]HDL8344368.1 type II toxin-antitoxin system HipA family toxin [Yersinia enterocolitica]HDL8348169.1 type II toxin-antitoxin system HipA family toxin [Yersinia enterocolitica]HDL8351372.1 type II toxin-antitoxin system HipA family toxin [Yersinia enterocolitica]
MARRIQRLNIWMNGQHVGYWEKNRGEESLTYAQEWLANEQGRPLSLSLPFTANNQVYRGNIVRDYFDNLLPDSDDIRRRLATKYHADSINPFDLLFELGRDCVGAIQLLTNDAPPSDLFSIQQQPLTESDVARILRNSLSDNAFVRPEHDEDLRLSIAGAQEKTALLFHDNRWCLPLGSTPTTHIFKLPLGLVGNMQADMRTSVENEWLCAKILASYNLPVASCEIGQFEDQKALIVERFDRRLSNDSRWIVRLPQEDMCQATGTSPLKKYQTDGGPGITTIMEILSGSDNASEDRKVFFKAQIIFWLLAATDGHAKNFSITHLPANHYHLTPLYDVLSTHPIIGAGRNQIAAQKTKLAMAVRGSKNYYLINQIQRRHWRKQAEIVGLGAAQADSIIDEIITATPRVITQIQARLPANFPTDLAESILTGLHRQCEKIAAMP